MKKYIYVQRDKLGNFYNVPVFDDHCPEDYTKLMIRSVMKVEDSKTKSIIKDCDLFHIGEYDDETGVITPIKEVKLLTLGDFIHE